MSYTTKEYLAHQNRVAAEWEVGQRLLACIPVLLAALRGVVGDTNGYHPQSRPLPDCDEDYVYFQVTQEAIDQARAAIAKTEEAPNEP